jgi:hypothetical protein
MAIAKLKVDSRTEERDGTFSVKLLVEPDTGDDNAIPAGIRTNISMLSLWNVAPDDAETLKPNTVLYLCLEG